MDANQLLFYLRGAFENGGKLSKAALDNIRAEVLSAHVVLPEYIPLEIKNGIPTMSKPKGDCGCNGFNAEPPKPVLQADKL